MARYGNAIVQYLDNAGDVLDGGKLRFFAAGTSTDKDTFSDASLDPSKKNPNPVILDAAGRAGNIFLEGGAYRVILFDKNDNQIWDADDVGGDEGQSGFADWNENTVYNIGNIVRDPQDGKFYKSLQNDNQGNDPNGGGNELFWEEEKFIQVWNQNVTYNLNDIVQGSNGLMYVSKSDNNLNNDPTSDTVNWGLPVDIATSDPLSESVTQYYGYDNLGGFCGA